jgi:hypothetical protein
MTTALRSTSCRWCTTIELLRKLIDALRATRWKGRPDSDFTRWTGDFARCMQVLYAQISHGVPQTSMVTDEVEGHTTPE